MKTHKFFWPGLILLAVSVAAIQQVVVTAHPQREPGIVCYTLGQTQLQCPFNPALATQQAGPAPTRSATVEPSATPADSPTRTATHTRVANTSTPTVTAAPPLLLNGDFEQPDHAGWTFVNLWRDVPQFNDERGDPRSRFDGAQSFRVWNNYYCVAAVLYQRVPVAPLTTLDFSVWVHSWMAAQGVFPDGDDPNAYDEARVGIDPSGGTNPHSSGIVWVKALDIDQGTLLTVRATSLANHITVFIWLSGGVRDVGGTACEWPHLNVYLFTDGARLALASAVSVALQPEIGQVAAISVQQTPTPTPATPPTEVTPEPYPVITRVAYP